ncbi:MAG: hypothetical protein QGH06_03375, partial [Lutibacter sp.]|nr:hypothetical protein [Lutibacter sp.]
MKTQTFLPRKRHCYHKAFTFALLCIGFVGMAFAQQTTNLPGTLKGEHTTTHGNNENYPDDPDKGHSMHRDWFGLGIENDAKTGDYIDYNINVSPNSINYPMWVDCRVLGAASKIGLYLVNGGQETKIGHLEFPDTNGTTYRISLSFPQVGQQTLRLKLLADATEDAHIKEMEFAFTPSGNGSYSSDDPLEAENFYHYPDLEGNVQHGYDGDKQFLSFKTNNTYVDYPIYVLKDDGRIRTLASFNIKGTSGTLEFYTVKTDGSDDTKIGQLSFSGPSDQWKTYNGPINLNTEGPQILRVKVTDAGGGFGLDTMRFDLPNATEIKNKAAIYNEQFHDLSTHTIVHGYDGDRQLLLFKENGSYADYKVKVDVGSGNNKKYVLSSEIKATSGTLELYTVKDDGSEDTKIVQLSFSGQSDQWKTYKSLIDLTGITGEQTLRLKVTDAGGGFGLDWMAFTKLPIEKTHIISESTTSIIQSEAFYSGGNESFSHEEDKFFMKLGDDFSADYRIDVKDKGNYLLSSVIKGASGRFEFYGIEDGYSNFTTEPSLKLDSKGAATIKNNELQLTPAEGNKWGVYRIDPKFKDNTEEWEISFDMRMYDGDGADGLSFHFGPKSNTDSWNEDNGYEGLKIEGGLSLNFTQYITSLSEAVYWKGTSLENNNNLSDNFHELKTITLTYKNSELSYNGYHINFDSKALNGYSPDLSDWVFTFAARTGASNNIHAIDNLRWQHSDNETKVGQLSFSGPGNQWKTYNNIIQFTDTGEQTLRLKVADAGMGFGLDQIKTEKLPLVNAPTHSISGQLSAMGPGGFYNISENFNPGYKEGVEFLESGDDFFVDYKVNVGSVATSYELSTKVSATGTGTLTFYTVNAAGTETTLAAIDFTNTNNQWQTVTISDVRFTESGAQVLRVKVTALAANVTCRMGELNFFDKEPWKEAMTNAFIDNPISDDKFDLSNDPNQPDFEKPAGDGVIRFTTTGKIEIAAINERYGVVGRNFGGWAEYKIIYSSNDDGVLNQPVFFVDGFDPMNTRGIDDLEDLITKTAEGQQFKAFLATTGHDLILVNFPKYKQDDEWISGGGDYIERNALLLAELIKRINHQKVLGTIDPFTTKPLNPLVGNVIIGPSMGGIITRYALNYLEMKHKTTGSAVYQPDTRLYVSFDSPHKGGHMPMGMQEMFSYLAGNNDFEYCVPVLFPPFLLGPFSKTINVDGAINVRDNLLGSPAGRQLLMDHIDGPHQGDIRKPHPYFGLFYGHMNNLSPLSQGFPETTRNIAITNGSGTNQRYKKKDGSDFNPGEPFLSNYRPPNHLVELNDFEGSFLSMKMNCWSGPMENQAGRVFEFILNLGAADCLPSRDIYHDYYSQTATYASPDAAAGGLFNFDDAGPVYGITDGLSQDFIANLNPKTFSFIPTVSALALDYVPSAYSTLTNWYESIADIDPFRTPFKSWSSPEENEEHVHFSS